MFINVLLLICALCLSTVAAYYSVVGLATIFAGAFWPVIIMGSILEASKLVVSSWLYRKWEVVPILLKTYLTTAVIILMIITSIGIFGFLSKAHIEQTGQLQENVAQIERYNAEISRQKFLYQKAEEKLKQLESVGTGSDVNIQNQINVEQQRIDDAYKRIQPVIDEQNKIIEGQTKIILDQVSDIDKQLENLQKYIDSGDVAKAQSMVGTRADGSWGPGTAAAVKNWQQTRKDEKANLLTKLEDINKNNTIVKSSREEIQRIRQAVETQIAESNKLINRLREQLGKTKVEDISGLINEQQEIIKKSNKEIDSLSEKKFSLETQYRKLEAEVGPIKYIANFIYESNTDKNLLEKSVTWMIIVIIFVFDPLAVLMIISANLGFSKLSNKPNSDDDLGSKNNKPIIDTTKLVEPKTNSLNVQQFEVPKQETTIVEPEPLINVQEKNIVEQQVQQHESASVETNLKKNDANEVLTVAEPVLQSIVTTVKTEDTNKPVMINSNMNIVKLNADEIIKRISANRPLVRYDARREWNGYKH